MKLTDKKTAEKINEVAKLKNSNNKEKLRAARLEIKKVLIK